MTLCAFNLRKRLHDVDFFIHKTCFDSTNSSFFLGVIVSSGLKQPHLGWPMISVSVHLQVFCWSCSTRSVTLLPWAWTVLLLTCALMCYSSLDLALGRCLELRARAAHQPALLPAWDHEVAPVLWSQGSSQSSMCSKTLCGQATKVSERISTLIKGSL